jgi:enoyl-[acyl-carrier protein] reductase II
MNSITNLFNIQYPIIQGGMVWTSGWRLAAAVSNAGGLGLIGAGSMTAELLEEHILKCKKATDKPFGVNIPLLYSKVEEQLEVIVRTKVSIVFTSAGNPMKYTSYLKEKGIKVVHVIGSTKQALKAQEAGVDAIVAEGFEAGGHNSKEETTSLVLIPEITKAVSIPVIAAGGIASGAAILAAMSLGASGVQIGTLFLMSKESSAHQHYKDYLTNLKQGETILTLKELTPVRIAKNEFYQELMELYANHASVDQLRAKLAKGRSKKGIFEGDLKEGELEVGQVASSIDKIKSVADIFKDLIDQYNKAYRALNSEL